MKKSFFFGLAALAFCSTYAIALPSLEKSNLKAKGINFSPKQDVRLDLQREEVFVHLDNTYDMTLTQEMTLLTQNGLLKNQTMSSPSYFPKYANVKLLEAYVIHPDGSKIEVPPDNIFTITSPSSASAPGFDTSLIQSVAFPQLMIGSRIHVKWLYQQTSVPDFPFADVISPDFDSDTLLTEMSVNVPETMYVNWAKEGNFQVKEVRENGRHIISAVLGPQAARPREPFMPADSDILPFFEVTTIQTWEEIGNTISKLTIPSQTLTPEIQKLAESIVGDKTGKEAAQALYNWTAQNIFYLNVVIDPRQGIVPPPASQVIFNRFGDCKGHSIVLQTLLKAVGIESYPVIVNWDNSLKQYPLPIPNFNHEMVYIPQFDIYANPTNLYNRFDAPLEETNFSDQFLQVLADKPVMIAKPKDSVLTKTPIALAEQNQYRLSSRIKMDLQGNMIAAGIVETKGCFDSVLRGFLSQDPSPSALINELAFSNGLNGQAVAKVPNLNNLNDPVKIEYEWEGNNIAQAAQEELFFQMPAAVDFFSPKFFLEFLTSSGMRIYPLIIGAAIYEWNHEMELPLDYLTKKLPENVNIINAAGSYVAHYATEKGRLQIRRKLELKKNVYIPEEYPDVAMLLMRLVQDGYSIFSLEPVPIKEFPGIPPPAIPQESSPAK